MALSSRIEWTEATWNPVTGCTKVSEGCKHCYAETMARRLRAMGQENYRNGFRFTMHERAIELPLHWRKPQRVFVSSMSDLFHESIQASFLDKVFDVMQRANWHQFLVLTKRSSRMRDYARRITWPSNVWAGVTVESKLRTARLDHLREVPAPVRFVSFEPLLTAIHDVDLSGINWIIVGGESGPGARPMDPEWAIELRDCARAQKVAFFFKQWGGVNKKKTGRELEGRTWDELPPAAQSA